MKKITLHTMADYQDEAVDCNTIYFQIEYSHAAVDAMLNSALAFCELIEELHQDQFISMIRMREIGKGYAAITEDELRSKLMQHIFPTGIIAESNVRSKRICTRRALRDYLNGIKYERIKLVNGSYALDFLPCYRDMIEPNFCDQEKLRKAIVGLLNLEHTESLNYCSRPDATGMFLAFLDSKAGSHCSGRITYSIMVGCLEKESLNLYAEQLVHGLKHICGLLATAGGRVGLCPFPLVVGNNPYMHYFGWSEPKRTEEFDNSLPENTFYRDWMKVFYANGCDWANVLSPYADRLLQQANAEQITEKNDFIYERINGGGSFIRSCKELQDFCHSDLLQMKKHLYQALYPGSRSFLIALPDQAAQNISWGVRSHWDSAPVFPEEFEIKNNWIVFKHG